MLVIRFRTFDVVYAPRPRPSSWRGGGGEDMGLARSEARVAARRSKRLGAAPGNPRTIPEREGSVGAHFATGAARSDDRAAFAPARLANSCGWRRIERSRISPGARAVSRR